MRYALVSDIHSNLQAWKNVLEDIQSNKVDKIICLGDLIGYGPNPAEIMRSLRNHVDAFVLGNHDAAVCGKLDISLFNDEARNLLEWTRKQLSEDDLKFMGFFPLTLIGDGFLCAHGSFNEPGNFDYIGEADEALPSWKATESNLLFVGHTHEPALFVLGASGIPRTVAPQDFVVAEGRRYLVNIGSVGQPRGQEKRSSYCLYDTETKSVYWRQVAFDQEAYQAALKTAGIPSGTPSPLTPEGTAPAGGDLDELRLVFTPPTSPEQAAHDVVTVQDLKNIPARRKKIPLNLISAAVVILLIAGIAIWKRTHPALDINGAGTATLSATSKTLLALARDKIEPGTAIAGWNTHVDNRYHQRIGVNLDTFGMPFCYLVSEQEKGSLSLSSPWIIIGTNQLWDLDLSLQQKQATTGKAELRIVLLREAQGQTTEDREFFVRTPDLSSGGWVRVRDQFTIPAGGTRFQFRVDGEFKGTLLIRQMNLKAITTASQVKPAAPQAATSIPMPPSGPSEDLWHQKAK